MTNMQPYSGKRTSRPVCRFGCCYVQRKCQPHYRKPTAFEKTLSRRRARAQAKQALRQRAG